MQPVLLRGHGGGIVERGKERRNSVEDGRTIRKEKSGRTSEKAGTEEKRKGGIDEGVEGQGENSLPNPGTFSSRNGKSGRDTPPR